MPSLKTIRKRITSVKSTQKITRAMKMVAGARLNRAQQRIQAMRPYAVKTQDVLTAVVSQSSGQTEELHPLLVRREEKRIGVLLLTGDRGLCGAYNANANKLAERQIRAALGEEKEVKLFVIGRKGRDYFTRRGIKPAHAFSNIWEKLGPDQARLVASTLLKPFRAGEIDAIYLVYTQFRSAMTQTAVWEPLLPVKEKAAPVAEESKYGETAAAPTEYIFEPDRKAILDRLVPMYIEITLLRALYESQASELGARMTAMDSATKNAKKAIEALTLKFNRTRQAMITKELMEIIGGAEAMKD